MAMVGIFGLVLFMAQPSQASLLAFNSPTFIAMSGNSTLSFSQPQIALFSLPPISTALDNEIPAPDERSERIDAYYKSKNMPLAGHGITLVAAADECDMDWRLLAAIGVQESSGGKHMMNNNPFGWGSAKIGFEDFDEAIETVSYNLCGQNPATASYYKDKTTYQKLWSYNGTVMHSYPNEVIAIMDQI